MEINNNEVVYPALVYTALDKYDSAKEKRYIEGWRYKADENERHININIPGSNVIKNVKKNRKKVNDKSLYQEQNIYTNYTACLGTNGSRCLQKNESDRNIYFVYLKSLKSNLQDEIDDVMAGEKKILATRNQIQKRHQTEEKMTEEAKEIVKDQIEEIKEKYTEENILNEIKQLQKFKIDKSTKHLNDYFFNHGSDNRELIIGNGCKDVLDYALLSHFYQIPNERFKNLESFYFKSICCYGGYFDNQTSVFDEIQHKLKAIKGNKKPKCFVRLLKKEYAGWLMREHDKGESGETGHFKFLPIKSGVEESKVKDLPSLDDIYDNPDNYYDYYYVEEDNIYKVSHDFVHNRKKLTENKPELFEEALRKDTAKNNQYGKVNKKEKFYEFYKKQEEIKNNEQKALDLKEKKNTYTRDYFYNFMKKPSNTSINNVSDRQNEIC